MGSKGHIGLSISPAWCLLCIMGQEYNEISSKIAQQIKVTVKYHNWRKKCVYYFGLSQSLVFYTSHNSGKHNIVV